MATGVCSYKSIEPIPKDGLEQKPIPQTAAPAPTIEQQENIRGADYNAPVLPFDSGGRPC